MLANCKVIADATLALMICGAGTLICTIPVYANDSIIPPGSCAIVVASDTSLPSLMNNNSIKPYLNTDLWIFSTKRGAVAAAIGVAPLYDREQVLVSLYENGKIGPDAFCMGGDKISHLAVEPPSKAIEVFGELSSEISRRQDSTEPKGNNVASADGDSYWLRLATARPLDEGASFKVKKEDGFCNAYLGKYIIDGAGTYTIEMGVGTSWGFRLIGDQPLAPMGGAADIEEIFSIQTLPLMSNSSKISDGWLTSFGNLHGDTFGNFFGDERSDGGAPWPEEFIPISTSSPYPIIIYDRRIPAASRSLLSCEEEMHGGARKEYCETIAERVLRYGYSRTYYGAYWPSCKKYLSEETAQKFQEEVDKRPF